MTTVKVQDLDIYPSEDEISIAGLNSEINIHAWFDPRIDKICIRVSRLPKKKYTSKGIPFEDCGGKSGCIVSVVPSALPRVGEGQLYPEVDISAKLHIGEH